MRDRARDRLCRSQLLRGPTRPERSRNSAGAQRALQPPSIRLPRRRGDDTRGPVLAAEPLHRSRSDGHAPQRQTQIPRYRCRTGRVVDDGRDGSGVAGGSLCARLRFRLIVGQRQERRRISAIEHGAHLTDNRLITRAEGGRWISDRIRSNRWRRIGLGIDRRWTVTHCPTVGGPDNGVAIASPPICDDRTLGSTALVSSIAVMRSAPQYRWCTMTRYARHSTALCQQTISTSGVNVSQTKVLFIGGSGVISSACSRLAVDRGFDLYVLNRGLSLLRPLPAGGHTIARRYPRSEIRSVCPGSSGV